MLLLSIELHPISENCSFNGWQLFSLTKHAFFANNNDYCRNIIATDRATNFMYHFNGAHTVVRNNYIDVQVTIFMIPFPFDYANRRTGSLISRCSDLYLQARDKRTTTKILQRVLNSCWLYFFHVDDQSTVPDSLL